MYYSNSLSFTSMELWKDIEIPKKLRPNLQENQEKISSGVNLWVGSHQGCSPLHFDSRHNFFFQVVGQ